MKTARKTTEEIWHERVRAWRESGKTADEFAKGKGFEGSTLRWWSSQLGSTPSRGPHFMQLVPRAPAPVAAPGLVVEVAGARVRVGPGFDAVLLADVVRALIGDAQ